MKHGLKIRPKGALDLVALGAQERTENDFRNLLNSAGFELTRVCPAGIVCVLEARQHSQ